MLFRQNERRGEADGVGAATEDDEAFLEAGHFDLVAEFRGRWLVRFLVLLPWTTPVALSTITWLWLLDSVFSPIDWALRQLDLIQTNTYWLGRPGLAMASVIAFVLRAWSAHCGRRRGWRGQRRRDDALHGHEERGPGPARPGGAHMTHCACR